MSRKVLILALVVLIGLLVRLYRAEERKAFWSNGTPPVRICTDLK